MGSQREVAMPGSEGGKHRKPGRDEGIKIILLSFDLNISYLLRLKKCPDRALCISPQFQTEKVTVTEL